MRKRLLPVLLFLLVFLLWIPCTVSAAENLSIQLDQHLPVTVPPGETISISVDLRNDTAYTWEDCVIILEDNYWLEIEGCDGAATYGNTGNRCYVQFKGLPVGTIYIHNTSDDDTQIGSVWFSEVVPVESFSIDNAPSGWGDGWCGRVVGGDTYFGDYPFNDDHFRLEPSISPANHEDCFVLEWTSSNIDVATISSGGAILKHKAGETTISATLSNGMTDTYNLVIVEPETLYPGYRKTITINPGEQCDFLFDVTECGKYSVYIPHVYELNESVSFGYDADQKCHWDYYGNYEIYTFDLSPDLSPLYCNLDYTIWYDKWSPTNSSPVTITVCFDKAPSVANPFSDVSFGDFYYSPVLWALENGITTGATETTFNPGGQCLRAQVVTFLHRAAENPEPTAINNPFTDVKPTDFFYKPVLWAVEEGITNGVSATEFGSYAVCNRAAVVTFLWRAAGSPEPTSTANPFIDVKTSDFFYKPVLWAIENGITNGVSATEFGPTADCNRAQVVTFLYRAYS